ncbi:MAG: hypothetical protein CMH57_15825 [Myxococcales bacterium]|nr:hypothetical protein [Myxococcales bacterium]
MGKREKKEASGPKVDPNAWMATFSDLVTLLITFFVLLLSMSSLDSKPLKDTFGFFDQRIGVLHMSSSSPQSAIKSTPISPPIYDHDPQLKRDPSWKMSPDDAILSEGIPDERLQRERIKPPKAGNPGDENEIMEVSEELEEEAKGDLRDLFDEKRGRSNRERFDQIMRLFRHPRYQGIFNILERRDNLTIHFAGELLFRPGRVLIRPESLVLLREVGALLTQLDVNVRVVGVVPGADAPPPARRDIYPDQWTLAIARSSNVVRYMASTTSVAPARLSGSVRPLGETGLEQDGVFFELRIPED